MLPNEPVPLGMAVKSFVVDLMEVPRRYKVVRTSENEDREGISRLLVLRRDNYSCVLCGNQGRLEVDHIEPWSAGGSDDLENLRTLCHKCNQDRSNFAVPLDMCGRLPNGAMCVHCAPWLVTDDDHPDVVPVYCITCDIKAPGIPRHG